MVSYGDVRRWRSAPLVDAEEVLTARARTLLGFTDDLRAAAKPAHWYGDAAHAAAAVSRRVGDSMDHIVAAVEAARIALLAASVGVAAINEMVAAADALAHDKKLVIDDAGEVQAGPTSLPGGDYGPVGAAVELAQILLAAVEQEHAKKAVKARVHDILTRAAEVDDALCDVLGRVERGDIKDRGATSLDAAAAAGASQGVPAWFLAPPPHPKADRGAGKHGSDPWWKSGDDVVIKDIARLGAIGAGLRGQPHAAKLMLHFLDNSGRDYEVNPDELMRALPRMRHEVRRVLDSDLRKITESVREKDAYDRPIRFTAPWQRMVAERTDSDDWSFGLHKFWYSLTGVVIVHRPTRDGDLPRVDVDYQTHIYDRYNWTTGRDKTHDRLAEMHRAGVAQEFDVVGSGAIRHESRPAPISAAGSIPARPTG